MPNMTWSTKVQAEFFPIIQKLADFYFLVQKLSITRFHIKTDYLSNLDFYIIAFSDGSADFSAACLYLISADRHSDICKTQLITTSSKIQTFKENDHISTVPQNETYAGWIGSIISFKILEIMQKMDLPVKRAILFIDAISTLISLGNHPAKYKNP